LASHAATAAPKAPSTRLPAPWQLRHPNVLSFKDSLEAQEKGGTAIYLVTEPVKPLAMVLRELDLSGTHRWAHDPSSPHTGRSQRERRWPARLPKRARRCLLWARHKQEGVRLASLLRAARGCCG
jgi:hypothetical protein